MNPTYDRDRNRDRDRDRDRDRERSVRGDSRDGHRHYDRGSSSHGHHEHRHHKHYEKHDKREDARQRRIGDERRKRDAVCDHGTPFTQARMYQEALDQCNVPDSVREQHGKPALTIATWGFFNLKDRRNNVP